MSRCVQNVLVLGLVLPLGAGCLEPTQIQVAVTTDVDCEPLVTAEHPPETGFTFGDPAVPEGPDHNTTTYECRLQDGPDYIGTITAVPSGDDDRAQISIRVVTAVGAGIDQCIPPDYGGECIVARRQLRYLPQTTLTVPIVMREACLGVVCPEGETCVGGDCVDARIESEQCKDNVCGEGILPEPTGQSPGTLGAEVQLTAQVANEDQPFLIWNEPDFALVWTDEREAAPQIYFMRFDISGTKLVDDISDIAQAGPNTAPVLTSAGSGFTLAFTDGTDAMRVRNLSQAGMTVGGSSSYSSTSAPTLATSAATVALAGDSHTFGIRVRLGAGGEWGGPIDVSGPDGSPDGPMLSATSNGFGLAWDQLGGGTSRQIFVALLETVGTASAPVQITTDPGSSTQPSIAATPTGFGLAWVDDRDGNEEIYFAVLDAAGAKIGADVRITNEEGRSDDPQLVWTGAEFGLVWVDGRDNAEQIFFTRLDAQGVPMGELVVTDRSNVALEPSLAWTSSVFGLAWTEKRDDATGYDLYFATVTPDDPTPVPQ